MMIRSLNQGTPRWRLEVRAATYPHEEWEPRQVTGKRYTFVDHDEAKTELAKAKLVQPHAVFRISPM